MYRYTDSKKRRPGISPKTALFCCGSERTLHGKTAAEEAGVRLSTVWWSTKKAVLINGEVEYSP